MGRQEDDAETPLQHRHDAEGAAFRHWRKHHQGGSWERFERERHGAQGAGPRRPLSPEASQRAFRAEYDTGDLSEEEQAQLQVGITPAMTPRRFFARFTAPLGFATVVMGFVVGHSTLLLGIPIALAGAALFVYGIVKPIGGSKSSKRPR